MDKKLKDLCKGMVRQALAEFNHYNRNGIGGRAEKLLVINSMTAVIDYMPNVTFYDAFTIREYVENMLARLLKI